jgi:uncharacterized protein (DUF433 family)
MGVGLVATLGTEDFSMTTHRIVRSPDVCFGAPRVEGTRWPTRIVHAYDCNVEVTLAAFPHLAPEQVAAAITYEMRLHRRLRRWLLKRTRAARLPLELWMSDDTEESNA